jgi:hypothetical protein
MQRYLKWYICYCFTGWRFRTKQNNLIRQIQNV